MNPSLEIIIHRESLHGWELVLAQLDSVGLTEWRVTPPGKTSTRKNAHVYGAHHLATEAREIGKSALKATAEQYVPMQFGGDD